VRERFKQPSGDKIQAGKIAMSVPTLELLLLAIGAGAGCVAALFAVLCFVRAKRPEGTLTKDNAPHLLRSETDVVRAMPKRSPRIKLFEWRVIQLHARPTDRLLRRRQRR
jgi:hypothetical protein